MKGVPPLKPSFFYQQGCTLDNQKLTENLAAVILTDTLSPLTNMHESVISPQVKSLVMVGTVFPNISQQNLSVTILQDPCLGQVTNQLSTKLLSHVRALRH